MGSLVLAGDTSGSVTLAVPLVAGSNTVTIPAGTGTAAVQGVSTNIVSGTAVASTSGTSIDFTSIPSWVKRITVMFNGVSTSGTSNWLIQLGSSGGIENTGYLCSSSQFGAAVSTSNYTAGFGLSYNAATAISAGSATFENISGNIWIGKGIFANTDSAGNRLFAGNKTLSNVLTQIRITTVNGTDTFDAGSINILYE